MGISEFKRLVCDARKQAKKAINNFLNVKCDIGRVTHKQAKNVLTNAIMHRDIGEIIKKKKNQQTQYKASYKKKNK